MLYTRAVSLLLVLLATTSHAFAGAAVPHGRARTAVRMSEDDPTGSPFIKAINSLQEAIQSSPAAQFKAKLAKMQAGNYDEAAVKKQLGDLMAEPAVMFSFTT